MSDNSAEGYDHQAHVHEWETEWIDPADWPAAKAALDALIKAESAEWVEIDAHHRIRRDGSEQEVIPEAEGKPWVELLWGQAYRKGREVAEAEQADFRDAVRKVAEETCIIHVGDMDDEECFYCGGRPRGYVTVEDGPSTWDDSIEHRRDCSYVQARKLLGM